MTASRPVFICHHAERSGGELVLADLLPELADLRPMVVAGADGPMVETWDEAGAEVRVVPYRATSGLRRAGPLAAGRAAVDIISWGRRLTEVCAGNQLVANSLPSGLAVAVTPALRRSRPVWAVHDHLTSEYLGRISVRTARLALSRWPGPVVANSESTALTIPGPTPVTVIPPATRPLATAAPDFQAPLTIAVVGRLTPWKGQDIAIDAFARAFPDGPQRLVIIGGALFGEEAFVEALHDRIRELGLRERITMTGHVSDVSVALADAQVLVHCSVLAEPFGRVVVEGLSAGRAIVASDAPSTRSILGEGEYGRLVPRGSIDHLAEALRDLDRDRSALADLGTRGPHRAATYAPAPSAARWRLLLDQQGAKP